LLRERQHVGGAIFAAPAVVEIVHHSIGDEDERQLGTLEA